MKNKVNGIFRKVCNILEWIISAILVVVVAVMCVSSDNRIIGTIGGGCAEAEVISHCRRLFRKQEFKCGLMDVSMNTDDAEKEGMVCGGSISVLLEQIG